MSRLTWSRVTVAPSTAPARPETRRSSARRVGSSALGGARRGASCASAPPHRSTHRLERREAERSGLRVLLAVRQVAVSRSCMLGRCGCDRRGPGAPRARSIATTSWPCAVLALLRVLMARSGRPCRSRPSRLATGVFGDQDRTLTMHRRSGSPCTQRWRCLGRECRTGRRRTGRKVHVRRRSTARSARPRHGLTTYTRSRSVKPSGCTSPRFATRADETKRRKSDW